MTRSFISGGFDFIHPGHVRLIEHAALLGDLTIGIYDDWSIQELRGKGRPVNPLADRMEVLYALRYVKEVIPFSARAPIALLKDLYADGRGPNVVCKGSEYDGRYIPERTVVERHGGTIVFLQHSTQHSTSEIIQKCK